MNHVTHPLCSADIWIFYQKSGNVVISRNTDKYCFWYIISHSFNFSWVSIDYLITLFKILMMPEKMGTWGLLKIMVFWNKGYGVIIPVNDVTNKILSCDSNYTVDGFMRPKFGKSSISMKEILTTSIL